MNEQNVYYDRYWAEGDKHTGRRAGYAENFRKFMSAMLSPGMPHQRGLEAGCGDASFTPEFAQYFRETHAVDISEAQVQQNRVAHPKIHFQQHDLSKPLPYADGFFDAVWCSEVLEHLFDPLYALREFNRVLAPGGQLLVTVPYHGTFKNVMISLFKWDHHFDPEYPHVRFFTKNSLGRIAEKAGLEEVDLQTCGMGMPLRDLLIPTNILLRARRGPRNPAPPVFTLA
jgi:SAM-dependent methyltransferase